MAEPYRALWSSVTVLPYLELSARYTEIDNVPGLGPNTAFGDLKDKAFDAKLLLFGEKKYWPQLAVGIQDFTGTQLFSTTYVVANKKLNALDVSIGYGKERIKGLFGGARYRPFKNRRFAFLLEYDANDYRTDPHSELSEVGNHRRKLGYGVEYTGDWYGAQLSMNSHTVGFNIYVGAPLMKKEFVPKIDEPESFTSLSEPGTVGKTSRSLVNLTDKLYLELVRRGFGRVIVNVSNHKVSVSLSHNRISLMSRAVGRAAKVVVNLVPKEIEEIVITYTLNDISVATYRITDPSRFAQEVARGVDASELIDLVAFDHYDPQSSTNKVENSDEGLYFDDPGKSRTLMDADQPDLSGDVQAYSPFRFKPFNMQFFFNDPSGVFHYDTFSLLDVHKNIGNSLFIDSSLRLTLIEDVSDVTQESNSLLPHVRTDIARYNSENNRLRLDRLILNKYLNIDRRLFARASAGYYESMFAGYGGQLLYIKDGGSWAFDLTLDQLKQRRPGDTFSLMDYSVISGFAGLHHRFSRYDITLSAKVGRFLAKDEGMRIEMKRRFRSGVEVGAWYTHTNGNDNTSPGRPGDPYQDHGVLMYVPLSSMLTRDTHESAFLSLSPWTRDVGQMVVSPGDLYQLIERPMGLGSRDQGFLTDFNH